MEDIHRQQVIIEFALVSGRRGQIAGDFTLDRPAVHTEFTLKLFQRFFGS